jgi:hypothetical protein
MEAMAMIIDVIGIPAPGGSKRAMRSASTGRVIVLEDCKRTPAWRQAVAAAALTIQPSARQMTTRAATASVAAVQTMPLVMIAGATALVLPGQAMTSPARAAGPRIATKAVAAVAVVAATKASI